MPLTAINGFRTSDGTFFTVEDEDKAQQYESEYLFRQWVIQHSGLTSATAMAVADNIMMNWNVLDLRLAVRPLQVVPNYADPV